MQLTRQTEYALRFLLFLTADASDDFVPVRRISDAYGISHAHVLKVAAALGGLGLVESRRGVSGGVRLRRPATEISVGEVVRALEPSLALAECMQAPPGQCVLRGACRLEYELGKAREAFLGVLDGVSLAECADDRGRVARLLRIVG